MNIPLLRKVQDAILRNPWAFNMHFWKIEEEVSPCGTAACISGWAAVLSTGKRKPSRISVFEASDGWRLLGLRGDYYGGARNEANGLCYFTFWPQPFKSEYSYALENGNYEAAALIAAARIEHFIETEGWE